MKNSLRIVLNCWIFLFFGGCTALPPHSQSDLANLKTTRSGIKIIDNAADFSQILWWKKIHDPVLNHLIQESLKSSNQVKTAEANVLQAQAKLKQAHFAWLPTLGASGTGFVGGGWDSNFAPQGALARSPVLAKMGSIHFRGYYSGFVPSYSLNILENINNDKFAKASLNMQRAVYQSTRLSIISQMSGSYFMLLGQKRQLREQSQLVRDLKRARQLEFVRFKDGAGDLSVVTNLDQQIINSQASLSSIENSVSQVENAIQVLLNHNPGAVITDRDINTISVRGLIPANLPSAVLKNRPDIIMAEESLNMSGASVGLAYSKFFPAISLTGLLGGASVELSHLLKLSTGFWVAEAAASMPILNGSAYEQINASKAGYSAAYFTYVQTVKSVFADVDNSLTNQQKMNDIYSNKLKALRSAEKLRTLALAKYRAGAKDYRDVAYAQVNVDYAKLDLNLAKMQQLDSIVEVYQALAGGYASKVSSTLVV